MVSTWWLPTEVFPTQTFFLILFSSLIGVGDVDVDDGGWLEVLRAIQERRRSR